MYFRLRSHAYVLVCDCCAPFAVLLNYERFRSLLESHRLGLDEASWLRRVEKDVMVRAERLNALAEKMETARCVDDLKTPEKKAKEREQGTAARQADDR